VPLAAAVFCHVPDFDFDPLDAAASQSDGREIDTSTVPLSAVAQLAGAAPVRIFRTADVPIVVSIASSCALRTATESCVAILT
jgi:hypothetical protein